MVAKSPVRSISSRSLPPSAFGRSMRRRSLSETHINVHAKEVPQSKEEHSLMGLLRQFDAGRAMRIENGTNGFDSSSVVKKSKAGYLKKFNSVPFNKHTSGVFATNQVVPSEEDATGQSKTSSRRTSMDKLLVMAKSMVPSKGITKSGTQKFIESGRDLDLRPKSMRKVPSFVQSARKNFWAFDQDQPWYMLHPNGALVRSQHLFIGLCVVWVAIFLPIDLCFYVKESAEVWNIIEQIVDIAFWIDLFLAFFTGYVEVGETRKIEFGFDKVALHYIRGW